METEAKRVKRRLAAILSADVAGYSRLMEVDEVATLRALVAYRKVIDRLIAKYGGRIANTAGDSVLAEFPSAVNAVECAAEVQHQLASSRYTPKLPFRIGIHVGDVMVRGGDLLGDGVNIAARLQALAKPEGICISGAVYDYVHKATPWSFTELGPQQLKNIDEPVKVYAVGPISPDEPSARQQKTNQVPKTPSIAVVPFINRSGDPEQEHLAEGIVEDILTALARFRWLLVIARSSSSTYQGQSVPVQQVGRELGVRYILEGSVRKAGSRIRVTVQLVEAETGLHLWAERYDRDFSDLFEVQDEITSSVVGAMEPELFAAEAHRVELRPASDLEAWECTMRSLPYIWRITLEDMEKAREWLGRAISLDPNYSFAHALMAWTYIRVWGMVTTDHRQELLEAAEQSARKAALLDDREPWTYFVIGVIHARRREPDLAIIALRRAIELNPNFALAHAYLGYALGVSGQPDAGRLALDHSFRLSPRDPSLTWDYAAARALIEFASGNYDEVIRLGKKFLQDRPEIYGVHRMMAAVYALLGREQEARRSLQEVLRLQPGQRLSNVAETVAISDPDALARYCEGLRKAGLPE